jgi:hypothetical protein
MVTLKKNRQPILERIRKQCLLPSELLTNQDEKPPRLKPLGPAPYTPVQFQQVVQLQLYSENMKGTGFPDYMCDSVLTVESDAGPLAADRKPKWRMARWEVIYGYSPPGDTSTRQKIQSMMGGAGGKPAPTPPPGQ